MQQRHWGRGGEVCGEEGEVKEGRGAPYLFFHLSLPRYILFDISSTLIFVPSSLTSFPFSIIPFITLGKDQRGFLFWI